MAEGDQRTELIRLLAAEWDGILDFVAGQSQLDVDARAELINAALSGTAEGQQYDLEAEARTLLAQVVETSGAFTDPAALGSAKVKVSIVARAGLVFADLGQLSPAVRNAAIEAGAYETTLANMRAITGSDDISLDALAHVSSAAFEVN